MGKDLKKILEEKLQQNNKRHVLASQEPNFPEGREFCLIKLDKIDPNPYQPRRIFPEIELNKLATSIAEVGLLEPILLRKNNDRYQIAAGERRWRAHKLLNKNTIESIVTSIKDDDMAVFALAENIDREDLADYEIGLAIRQIESVFSTKKKLAESLGLNREDMYKYFAFDDLPEFIRADLNNNPRLLSRSAANDIKRLLNQHKESKLINSFLKEAWSLLLNSELEQTKITNFISKKLKSIEEGQTSHNIQNSHNLTKEGQKIGNVAWTSKHLTVKLNTNIIDVEKEQKILNFLEALVDGKMEKA